MTDEEKFWPRVDICGDDECWEWLGYVDKDGYGALYLNDRMQGAHRAAWTLTYGPIPEGMCICHHCDNRPCCNPNHLFLGTRTDNSADMVRKGRGRGARGEQSATSKLVAANILDIRALYATGEWTHRELAKEFGVGHTVIGDILRGETWTHVLS